MIDKTAAPQDLCKAALCVEICDDLGFDPSNLPFSPQFSPEAEAAFDRLCSSVCDTCPIREKAEAMAARRHQPATQ